MNDYKVAAFPKWRGKGKVVGQAPEGKQHAYLEGAKATACGFGLVEMHLFDRLPFSGQPQSARCRICARIVVAVDR